MIAAVAVVLVGCVVSRPPDSVALSIYARNLSPDPFAFVVVGSHEVPVTGEAGTEEPRSYGCGWVGRDWQLIVAEGSGAPDPAEPFVAARSGEDFGSPSELAIWIDVDAAGRVSIGNGVPAWWTSDVQRCP